jgi:ABC-type uncharacterized transport system permease subunit
MKQSRSIPPTRFLSGLSAAVLGFLPTLAAAHPGHYHPPGEDDEFDALTVALHSLPNWQSLVPAAALLGVIALVARKHNSTPAL